MKKLILIILLLAIPQITFGAFSFDEYINLKTNNIVTLSKNGSTINYTITYYNRMKGIRERSILGTIDTRALQQNIDKAQSTLDNLKQLQDDIKALQ